MLRLVSSAGYVCLILALLVSIMSTAFSLAIQIFILGVIMLTGAAILNPSS